MLWNTIFLFYSAISLINSFTQDESKFYDEIINDFYDLVKNNSNPALYAETNTFLSDCLDSEGERKNNNTLYNLINYSGKSFGDPGFENDCKLNGNNTFLLLFYSLDTDELLANQQKERELLEFLNTKNFTTGICVYKKCLPFIKQLLSEEENKILFDKIKNKFGS